MENEENEAANDLNPNLIENINVNLNYNRDGQVAINIEATNEHSNEELAAEEIMVPPYMVPQQLIEIGQPVDINAEVSVVMDAPTENNANQTDYNLDLSDAQSSPSHKKRKRSSTLGKKPTPKKQQIYDDDDDDGTTCSICLDSWELNGNHRVVSLKCGHLFGESCIRRWIRECSQTGKCCPTCKSRSHARDIRGIFARKICAVDKSEEYRLRDLVEMEKTKNIELQDTISKLRIELAIVKDKYNTMEAQLESAKINTKLSESSASSMPPPKMYRMALDKNIELNREPGCRTMAYGRRSQMLILSQKSAITLFPGYGVRFLNAYNLQITNSFLHISSKQLRDISLDNDEELLITASIDKGAKLFSVPNKCPISQFTPSDSLLWAVAFDRIRTKHIYTGTQNGNTYLYDIRNPQTYVEEFSTVSDSSPVISITSVPAFRNIPFGGFIVCKLQSLWFYEYTASQQIIPTKLMIDGPFVSMTYDDNTKCVLVSTRPTSKYGAARHLVGTLVKIEQTVVFNVVGTIIGSKAEKVMTRSTQFKIDDENLIAAYLQDTTTFATWNVKNTLRMQSLVVKDIIYDTCPMYINNRVYLAALSDSRCRIYNVNTNAAMY